MQKMQVDANQHGVVETLLKNGAASVIDEVNENGTSPLSFANARKSSMAGIVKLLERYKLERNKK